MSTYKFNYNQKEAIVCITEADKCKSHYDVPNSLIVYHLKRKLEKYYTDYKAIDPRTKEITIIPIVGSIFSQEEMSKIDDMEDDVFLNYCTEIPDIIIPTEKNDGDLRRVSTIVFDVY
jgi:hypothetical protein